MLTVHSKNTPKNIVDLNGTVIYIVSEAYQTEMPALFEGPIAQRILSQLEAASFKANKGDVVSLYAPEGFKANKVIFVGTNTDLSLDKIETLSQKIASLFYNKEKEVSIYSMGDFFDKKHFFTSLLLRCYQFDDYKATDPEDTNIESKKVTYYGTDYKAVQDFIPDIEALREGVFYARDLVSEPANILNPEEYAIRLKALSKIGLKVTILDEKKMAKLGMHSLLGVGQGSPIESKAVIMEWKGTKKKEAETLALVGKGVTFDTGGISLKPGRNMWDMIFDMGGSAAVVGTMITLATRQAEAHVVGIVGLVENMPDGCAQKPGDVVTTMSGKTVEVLNTDAEGRLVLADVMTYVQKKYKISSMIDLATLTGAIISALGHEYAGLFSNDQEFQDKLMHSSKETGEKIWPFPMGDAFSKKLKSRVADVANISTAPEAGSITAAEFLKHFVEDGVKWAHLDIAGTAWQKRDMPLSPKGATGFGVALLNHFVQENFE